MITVTWYRGEHWGLALKLLDLGRGFESNHRKYSIKGNRTERATPNNIFFKWKCVGVEWRGHKKKTRSHLAMCGLNDSGRKRGHAYLVGILAFLADQVNPMFNNFWKKLYTLQKYASCVRTSVSPRTAYWDRFIDPKWNIKDRRR